MQCTPFKLINESEWRRLHRLLEDIAQAWSRHWLMEAPGSAVECLPANTARHRANQASEEWRQFESGARQLLHVAAPASVLRRFAVQTFGEGVNHFDPSSTGPSQILAGVFDAATRDLAARVWRAAGKAPDERLDEKQVPPGAAPWRRGSGAVLVKFPLGKDAMEVLLDGALVLDLLGSRINCNGRTSPSAAVPQLVKQCVDDQRILLQAWAGEVEIGLGLLQTLAPGDVIRLEASIHEPLRLTLSGAATGVRAYLGSVAERKALQLTSQEKESIS